MQGHNKSNLVDCFLLDENTTMSLKFQLHSKCKGILKVGKTEMSGSATYEYSAVLF